MRDVMESIAEPAPGMPVQAEALPSPPDFLLLLECCLPQPHKPTVAKGAENTAALTTCQR